MSVTQEDELAAARARADWPEDESAESVADRAANDDGEPTQEEMFPKGVLEGDNKVTLAKLIRANESVEVTASLMSAEVPLRGGLVDPRREGKVVVSYEAARYIPVPQREGEPGDKKVKGWKVRCQLRPTYVEPADAYYSEEDVLMILERAGIPRTADVIPELLGKKAA
jgi:hypothetical protein